MINLIPTHGRKQLSREYWIRVVSLWMIMGSVAALILTVLLVPSYVFVTLQRNAYSDLAAEAEGRTQDYAALATEVTAANDRAGVLIRASDNTHEVTEIISNMKELSGAGVSVTEVRITRDKDGALAPISVTGVALTRAELARFRNELEAQPQYETVDLPISNLAKDVDIDFSVTVTLANSKAL